MKIFIAGARSVKYLPPVVCEKMHSIYLNGYDVLVGDCYGADKSVQTYFAELKYRNVSVYASNGIARNNVGNWNVKAVEVPPQIRGFDFYRQKDIAMAADADYGFMIWDGKSRGTYSNLVTLIENNKSALVYLTPINKLCQVNSKDGLKKLLGLCKRMAQNGEFGGRYEQPDSIQELLGSS